MEAKDVLDFYQLFESEHIDLWLVGGWAVDALLKEQTRKHADLDIIIQEKDLPKMLELLEAQGYGNVDRDDTTPWNFVLADNKGHEIDVHAIVFDQAGNGIYGPAERDVMFSAASLTGKGEINGHPIKCISAQYMVKFISPWLFKLRDKDFKDVAALCKRFEIELPEEYKELFESKK